MEVCVNSYPVDFELEGEKTVSEIVESVSEWARERELVFTEVLVDDTRYFIDDLPGDGLGGVSSINCIVRSKADVVFSTIDEGMRYCDRVQSFFKDRSDEGGSSGADLASGIDWLMEVVDALFALLGLSPDAVRIKDRAASEHFDDMRSLRNDLKGAGNDDETKAAVRGKESLFSEMKDMFKLLIVSNEMKTLIVQSIDSPDMILQSLKSLKDEFSAQMENIEETAIAYQTGKDSEGSAGMERFIDFVYRYTRTCYQAVPVFQVDLKQIALKGVTLEEKNGALHDFLNQTIIILENNDIISLSDMLEYEILPALGDLGDYLDLLIEAVTARD